MTSSYPTSSVFNAINDLPSIAPVVRTFEAVAANPASSAEDVVKILKLDPALSGKVLRLANSAYAGIPNAIASLKSAVVLLGHKRIYSILLASGVLSILKKTEALPFCLDDYRRHSVCVAVVAESISKFLHRYGPIDSDDVFTGGLMHDIGKLVAGCLDPKLLSAVAKASIDRNIPFFMAENPETSHTVAGGLLARHWNFPRGLADTLMFHHVPEKSDRFQRMVSIVHVADVLTHMAGRSTFPGEPAPQLQSTAVNIVNLPPERLRTIANETIQNEKTIESLLNCLGQA
jgi:putative nucleotidyltransferase with HDIG domain